MLATVRRLSFHYTPLPTKYLYDPPPDRHRLTTYAKIKLEKIAPRADFIQTLGKLGYGLNGSARVPRENCPRKRTLVKPRIGHNAIELEGRTGSRGVLAAHAG